MNDDIVCLSLYELCKTLPNDGKEYYTFYGHTIYKDGDYYDLYKTSPGSYRLCCDGEQCKVLERTDRYVKLIDVENIDVDELEGIDTTFKLSIEEFEIAAFGGKIEETD